MEKKILAIIFGEKTAEHEVSLQSAYSVFKNLNNEKYLVVPIGITRKGDWYRYYGSFDSIFDGTWDKDVNNLTPVVVSQYQNQGGIIELSQKQLTKIDLAFPVLHGKNGEDGTVQGLFELFDIRVIGCGTLASALCMDKDRAHSLVKSTGISVPESITINVNFPYIF